MNSVDEMVAFQAVIVYRLGEFETVKLIRRKRQHGIEYDRAQIHRAIGDELKVDADDPFHTDCFGLPKMIPPGAVLLDDLDLFDLRETRKNAVVFVEESPIYEFLDLR